MIWPGAGKLPRSRAGTQTQGHRLAAVAQQTLDQRENYFGGLHGHGIDGRRVAQFHHLHQLRIVVELLRQESRHLLVQRRHKSHKPVLAAHRQERVVDSHSQILAELPVGSASAISETFFSSLKNSSQTRYIAPLRSSDFVMAFPHWQEFLIRTSIRHGGGPLRSIRRVTPVSRLIPARAETNLRSLPFPGHAGLSLTALP